MTQILFRLAAVTSFSLVAAFVAGLVSFFSGGVRSPGPAYPLHFYLGLFAVLLTLAVHCLIFIYFLGTGRWVKEVALAYRMPDQPLPKLTRELKRKTFPPALFAMLVPIATAAAGTAAQRQEWHWTIHLGLAVATLAVNAWAFVVEYRAVTRNAWVIEEVMREVDRLREEEGLPSNAEALRQAEAGEREG
jgi:amino acid transporter